jgi:hypothetical protein
MAASDALYIQRTLVALVDGGSLLPLDREIVRRALAALERGEILRADAPDQYEDRGENAEVR